MPEPHLPVLSVVLALAACVSGAIPGPPAGLPYAAATRACGPGDGPAVAIFLAPTPLESSNPPAPHIRITIWQPLERLGDQSWQLAHGDAAASYVSAAGDVEVAASGSVAVRAVDADSTVRGWALLTFPTLGPIEGGFQARWLSSTLLCG